MQLIATLGPRARTPRAIRALRDAGAGLARLNASHLEPEPLAGLIQAATESGFAPDEIVVDLQGGKTRIGRLGEPIEVRAGEPLLLGAGGVEVDRPAFLGGLRVGDTLRIDDGRVAVVVENASAGRVETRVLEGGRILARKGLALAGRLAEGAKEAPSELLARDEAAVGIATRLGVSRFAVSYANSARLLELTRHSARQALGGDSQLQVRIAAKIEHPVALDRLDELAAASDELWLCRGDLGAEAGLERLPGLQERFLEEMVGRARLVIAGQVFHHLTVSPRPTRSEVCHVADLVRRGVAGFVLSDETATGPHGPAAVDWLARVTASSICDS